MKILVLKEAKSRKPDLVTNAVTEAFAQCDDVAIIATVKVGGVLKTVTTIKELVKQYKPDIVVAQKILASIILFELPKSIKKIIIDPYLLFDDSDDDIKIRMMLKYGSVQLNNWLNNASYKFVNTPNEIALKNSYCIVRNFMNNFAHYDRLVTAYTTCGKKNIFLGSEDSSEPIQNISTYHRVLSRARLYFDPNFELPNENELLNKE